jgi:hypothetical protein
MSWDVVVFGSRSASDQVPGAWMPVDMGSLAEVRQCISKALPETEWIDDETGFWQDQGLSLEIGLRERPEAPLVNLVMVRFDIVSIPLRGTMCRR